MLSVYKPMSAFIFKGVEFRRSGADVFMMNSGIFLLADCYFKTVFLLIEDSASSAELFSVQGYLTPYRCWDGSNLPLSSIMWDYRHVWFQRWVIFQAFHADVRLYISFISLDMKWQHDKNMDLSTPCWSWYIW